MEDNYLKLKFRLSLFLLFLISNLNAIEVIVAKTNIKLNEKISLNKLMVKNVKSIRKKCEVVTLKDFENRVLAASHFINKNSIVCKKDLKDYAKDSVVFDFGNIQIEKNAKIVNENSEFIMIKNANGKKEKIYKDGTVK